MVTTFIMLNTLYNGVTDIVISQIIVSLLGSSSKLLRVPALQQQSPQEGCFHSGMVTSFTIFKNCLQKSGHNSKNAPKPRCLFILLLLSLIVFTQIVN
jgi:hypothetical protein